MNSIISFLCGDMKNLSYLIVDDVTSDTVIVDPTWEVDKLLMYVKYNNLKLVSIWLTHTHFDHIKGIGECLDFNNSLPIYVHQIESDRIDFSNVKPINNESFLMLGKSNWQVIHTPGHSPGGVCFYSKPNLICGDTLFVNGCGRADISGADVNDLYASILTLKQLPGDTLIYPGHDYARRQSDSLTNQLKSNRFLRVANLDDFIKLRMK